MKNKDLRSFAKQHGVFLWQVADYIGVREMTVSRKLRRELPEDEKEKMRSIILDISKTNDRSPNNEWLNDCIVSTQR